MLGGKRSIIQRARAGKIKIMEKKKKKKDTIYTEKRESDAREEDFIS